MGWLLPAASCSVRHLQLLHAAEQLPLVPLLLRQQPWGLAAVAIAHNAAHVACQSILAMMALSA